MDGKNLVLLFLIAILASAGVYFFSTKGYSTTGSNQITNGATANPSASQSPAREIIITGTEYSFDPSTISASSGERLKIIFKNQGLTSHNLVFQNLGIGTQVIDAGQTDSFEFTVPQAGSYQYVCTIDGHQDKGMSGVLEVK